MKKQFISMLTILAMCLTLLPTAALAEETPEDGLNCICTVLCDGEHINTACPVCGAENADLSLCRGKPASKLTITEWAWLDPDEVLNDGGLAIPGVNEEMQADFDTVVSMLPEKINATLENTDATKEILLDGWSCDAYQKDENEQWPITGDYTFSAALPEDYSLGDNADKLEVVVTLGGASVLNTEGAFTITGDGNYTYAKSVLTVKNGADITISMATSEAKTSDRIVVDANAAATITLNGVSIAAPDGQPAIDLSSGGKLTLNLANGSTNTLTGAAGETSPGAPGIHVPTDAALLIQGAGSLNVAGGASDSSYGGAGIGGNASTGDKGEDCGTVLVLAENAKITGGNGTSSEGNAIGGGRGSTDGDNGTGIRRDNEEDTYTVSPSQRG